VSSLGLVRKREKLMNDEYHYKYRLNDVENELAAAKKTIAILNKKLYDIGVALRNRNSNDPASVLEAINYIYEISSKS
jgi:hypothetical protein